ncbi:hemolysin family protein [Candidatus Latescibacterota bacterium]
MSLTILMFVGFIGTLISSILFTGTEIAIRNISRDSLEKLVENRIRGASLLLGVFGNKRRYRLLFISGRIMSITGGTLLLYGLVSRLEAYSGVQSGIVAFFVSFLFFVVADILPARMVALGEFEKVVSRFAYLLIVFHFLIFPLIFILEKISSLFIERNIEMAVKEEALIEFVKSESEDGVIEEEEKEMIESILEFSDTIVREVMVPRIDMVAAKKEISIDKLIAMFEDEGHSRIPIYEDRMDNIIGFIYAKDLLPAIARSGKENINIDNIMRTAYFVPETKMLSDLLKEFKKTKVHIAIVVDEYGGTAGVVALEDLLEEIVGEIQDEYDEEEQEAVWLDDRTVLLDGGHDIGDINELLHSTIPDEDFETLGGFLYHQLGFIPSGGETVNWENITFTVKEIVGNRISKVIIELDEQSNSHQDNEE